MELDLIGAVIAFLAGVAVAAANFSLSKWIIKKHSEQFAISSIARQLIQLMFLFAVFLIAPYTRFDEVFLLVGGALGVTLPSFYFTSRLVKLNDSLNKKGEEDLDG